MALSPSDTDGETLKVEIDTSDLVKKEEVGAIVEKYLEAHQLVKDDDGVGHVEEAANAYNELCESVAEKLKSGSSLREQWAVAVPLTTLEGAAHLRDFVNITPGLKLPKAGKTINVPYVKDFDLKLLAAVGDSTTSIALLGSTTAEIVENMAWARQGYHEVEEYNSNVIDQINQAFVRAAVRGEDRRILAAIVAKAATSFADQMFKHAITTDFVAAWIPEAIGKLLVAGKEVNPGETVCYMTPVMYGALLAELSASQPAAFATPEVLRTGRVVEYCGVRIVVGSRQWFIDAHKAATATTYACAMVARLKRAVVLAPKRDLLIETERDTTERDYKITGSHTLAVDVVDPKEIVEILTSA